MAIKQVVTRSSGRRKIILVNYKKTLSADSPLKSLTTPLNKTGGRNNTGRLTVRHRGGGHKRRYRIIDFKRNKDNIPGIIKTIEYDPNRSGFISLVAYLDGERRYILTPEGIKVGDRIVSGEEGIDAKVGNCMPIGKIMEGTFIHNIELDPGRGGKLARAAGAYAQVLGKDSTGKFTVIKLTSKENRKIPNAARVTIGAVSNADHSLVRLGKAGKSRYLGIRPTVRGSAMNPNDHIHGGGEGRSPIGRDAPRTPWGKKCMGVKTRKKTKRSNSMIVVSRHFKNKK
ncbi:50S ribosomal protein L2 [Candidatus Mycoplasma haematohominis]|uniref:Large ribosomal subunit protein uL2 n=1 Tax=Candidatus Mycoplasma haematohominis TaxID=1494318 RepID=A0A478FSC3_9MOLU|nr:50S ribosomal protein L2 [Candidatus Mycoplasma haemohominis]GCE63974.1 50S ribosomal protein L2 [Candidatus Mycoplasma haemohominis]